MNMGAKQRDSETARQGGTFGSLRAPKANMRMVGVGAGVCREENAEWAEWAEGAERELGEKSKANMRMACVGGVA